jgi:hypothetical protein
MATVADLEALGYKTAIASGSVQVEEDALHNARVEASPQTVTRKAGALTRDTVTDLANAGQLPVTVEDRRALVDRILEAATEMISGEAAKKVAFHEDALAGAQAMADTWCVQQFANGALIVQTYVNCKDDGSGWDKSADAALAALADKKGYAEREYQALNPEAMQAAQTLSSLGHACTRPKPGADVFEVDGATYSGKDLRALAAKRAAEPPPLTPAERVVAVLEASPELSDATKKKLRGALG